MPSIGLGVGLVAFGGCANGDALDVGGSGDPALPSKDASRSAVPNSDADRGEDPADDAGHEGRSDAKADAKTDAAPDAKEPVGGGKPTQGEVLISEVMYDPSGTEPSTEWIEIHNTASSSRTLSGLDIVDGADRAHTIGSGVTIAAGAYVVLARDESVAISANVPASAIVYEYGAGQTTSTGVQLANGATGGVAIKDGATIIAQAKYGGWFSSASGASVQLKTLTFAAGSSKSDWCTSTATWASGSDKGTPGAANNCP